MSEGPLSAWSYEPRRIEKPWGHELLWAQADEYVGKILVHDGLARLELGEAGEELVEDEIGPGDCFRYRPGTVHRITAIADTTILEVSTPHLDDVVRLEDRYGRGATREP